MTDVLTSAQRHRCMAAIRSKNTGPELAVRRIVTALGFRYRLHRRDLPGSPDLVFGPLRRVILVHGCFWHLHNCRYGRVRPKTNAKFWQDKRASNRLRDRRSIRALRQEGWKVLVIWECQLRDPERIAERVIEFLALDMPTK